MQLLSKFEEQGLIEGSSIQNHHLKASFYKKKFANALVISVCELLKITYFVSRCKVAFFRVGNIFLSNDQDCYVCLFDK